MYIKLIVIVAVFIGYYIVKQIGVDSKFKCMTELEIAEYYQVKSGFPSIFRHLLCNELFIVLILSIFGLIYNKALILIAVTIIVLNAIVRYKADKSLPILWWIGKRKDA